MINTILEKLSLRLGSWHLRINSMGVGKLAVFILLLNLLLKGMFLGIPEFGMDEPFTLFRAQQHYHELITLLAHNNHPPLFESIMWVWMRIVGYDHTLLRIVPLLFSSLAAVLFFKLLKSQTNNFSALLGSLIFTFSNQHIYFSHEIRSYPLFACVTLWSLMAFLKLFERDNKWDWLHLGMANAVILYTHYFGSFVILSEGLCVLIFLKRKKLMPFIVSGIISVALYIPQLYMVLNRMVGKAESGHWLAVPSLSQIFNLLKKFTNLPSITIIALVILAFLIIQIKKKNNGIKAHFIWLMALLFPGMYLLMWLISQQLTIFHDRYVSFTTFGLFALLALAAFATQKQLIKWGIAILIVLPMALSVQLKPNHGMAYPEVIQAMKPFQTDESEIIITPGSSYMQFSYHYNLDYFKDYANTISRFDDDGIFMKAKMNKELIDLYLKRTNRLIIITDSRDIDGLCKGLGSNGKLITSQKFEQLGLMVIDRAN